MIRTWIVLVLAVFGLTTLAAFGAEVSECGPCKIIATIKKADGAPFRNYQYPVTFATGELCAERLNSEPFKLAMADLQSKVVMFGLLGKDFEGMTSSTRCAPLDEKIENEH